MLLNHQNLNHEKHIINIPESNPNHQLFENSFQPSDSPNSTTPQKMKNDQRSKHIKASSNPPSSHLTTGSSNGIFFSQQLPTGPSQDPRTHTAAARTSTRACTSAVGLGVGDGEHQRHGHRFTQYSSGKKKRLGKLWKITSSWGWASTLYTNPKHRT